MKKIVLIVFISVFFAAWANAQVDTTITAKPKHSIKMYTLNGNSVDGILTRTSDTAVFMYSGNFKEWKQQKSFPITATPFTNINKIETRQKGPIRVLKGMLIGAGIGLVPVLASGIFGRGEGGAYVSLVAVPLGTVLGAVIGATSKKKFHIEGDKTKFQKFRKKVKK